MADDRRTSSRQNFGLGQLAHSNAGTLLKSGSASTGLPLPPRCFVGLHVGMEKAMSASPVA